MAMAHDRFGLIILGNSGVGKSFLANTLLGRDAFTHESTAEAVTTKTEYHEVTFEEATYAIFNIPGLIEAKQTQINTNKREIDKAFKQCPNAVIIYVFGNQNGRIRREDAIAFNALNDAYPFQNKSLVLVVNCMPPLNRRGKDYEGKTIAYLRELLKLKGWQNVCFLDDIGTENQSAGKQKLREQLLPSILASMPKVHVKRHDIHLEADEIDGLMKEYELMVKKFSEERAQADAKFRTEQEQHQREMEAQKLEYDNLIRSTRKQHKREMKEHKKEIKDLLKDQGKRQQTNARESTQKEQNDVDAGQKQENPNASNASNSSAWQRGMATAATAGAVALPFGPLAAGLSAAGGFVAGYFGSE